MIWGFIFCGSWVSEMMVAAEDGNSMGESPLCGKRKGWQETENLSKGVQVRENEWKLQLDGQ